MKAVVATEELTFSYRAADNSTLRSVSFEVSAGESVALMGPSGSGKSTFLALLGGLLEPTGGVIRWRGKSRADAVRIGWIQQTTNVFGRRSAVDNVGIARFADGESLSESRALSREALRSVGLGSVGSRPVNSMSGGEVQRVVIARSLVSKPDLILADEPTGQLDQTTTDSVLDVLFDGLSLVSPFLAIVVATHDLSVASRCDRVVQIADGRFVSSPTK